MNQDFEELFVEIAEKVEIQHDFENEIRAKKEAEKLRMIKEI